MRPRVVCEGEERGDNVNNPDKLEVLFPIKHSLTRKLEVENEIISLGTPSNVGDNIFSSVIFYSPF